MINIDDDIATEIKNEIISSSLSKVAKRKNFKPRDVLEEVNARLRQHQNKSDETYWLLTSINIKPLRDMPRYRVDGCTISFYSNIPSKFRKARTEIISNVSSWLPHKDHPFDTYVVINGSGKSQHDVVGKMLDAIDFLRGIWNLQTNKAMSMSFGGRKKPVNQIILGGLHSLHDKNGNKASDTFWYEPNCQNDHKNCDLLQESYKALAFTKNVRSSLRKHKYENQIRPAVIRYARALDSADYDSVFIKLWSLLEYLTSTLRDTYDKTIKRTAFHFEDHHYHKQVLEHLRQYRNRSVHMSSGENDIETHVYQLKNYVEQLLRFHIVNYFNFTSLEESTKMMDLSPDTEALKKQIKLYEAGIHFRNG